MGRKKFEQKKMLLISICLLLLTITAVSAQDNETSEQIQSADNQTATFSDLQMEIAEIDDGGVLNLTKDYKYDSGQNNGIIINKTITINGNNHILDGNFQSRIFYLNKGQLILNNLTLENGNSSKGGAIFASKPLTLNNVVFKNNTARDGGAIYLQYGGNITNCIFDENHAVNGSAAYMSNRLPEPDDDEEMIPAFNIDNTAFKNSYGITKGLLYVKTPDDITITPSTFANSTLEYATAIFCNLGATFKIRDCRFENLHSTRTGGAFLFVQAYNVTLDDCQFVNVSSDTIGGVMYALMSDTSFGFDFDVNIKSCEFKNSMARFGGVIAQVGGILNIEKSIFDNNTAISGGAIYTSDCKQTIKDSIFSNNILDTSSFEGQGGAIYAFLRTLEVDNSRFINNSVNALYCAENQITVTNTYFKNNTQSIESAYDKKRTFKNNTYNDDILNLTTQKDTTSS